MARFLSKYTPDNQANRMAHAGNLENARREYVSGKNRNLQFLLRQRGEWMNEYLSDESVGVELGAGIGSNRDYLTSKLRLSDYSESVWLDYKNVDALETPFQDAEFDFVVASNMIHHVAFPNQFLNECARILKSDGILLIQDIHTSVFMRTILKVMRHEGFDETIDIFDTNLPVNDPRDPWSANCSVPKLLFKDKNQFEFNFDNWKIEHIRMNEFLTFLNSGGVIAKTKYLPLPTILLTFMQSLDNQLTKIFPRLFALQMRVVLRKK